MSYTSSAAYFQIEANGLLSRMRWIVYNDLAVNGPSTAGEVTSRLIGAHVGNPSYHRRLSELEELKVAHRTGTRPCSVTGYDAEIWEVIPNALPQGKIKPRVGLTPKRSQIKAAVGELLELIEFREANDPNYVVSPEMAATFKWLAHRAGVTVDE
jgi:hypothetical protein